MYSIIYYIYGHSFYIDKTDPQNDPLNIELEPVANGPTTIVAIPDVEESTTSRLTRIKFLLGFIYNAIIISILSWSIPYLIINAFQMRTKEELHSGLFQLMFVTQYIIGLWYFNSESYKKSINRTNDIKKNFRIMSGISLIMVVCMTILTFLLNFYDVSIHQVSVNITQYTIENNTSLIGQEGASKIYQRDATTQVFHFINKFYSYASYFANMTLFFVQMHYNKKILTNYTKEIKEYIQSSYSLIDKVTSITVKFQEIKNEYDSTIDDLNLFFSSLSIIGVLGLYFTMISIFTGNVDSIEIINSILFLLTEIMYINTAQGLRSSIEDITNSIIKNPVLIQRYNQKGRQYDMLINNDPNYDKREIDTNLNSLQEICTVTYMCCKEMEEQMLWTKLDDILKAEWNTFQFFGIKIKDTTLLQKVLGLIIAFIFTANLISVTDFNAFGE